MTDAEPRDLSRLRADQRVWLATTLFTRISLAAGFLSAIADRLGLWGGAGTSHVAWGNFDVFTQYVHLLAPYLPAALQGAVAWAATLIEAILACALLLGIVVRWTALASAATLMVFATSMFVFSGFEAPLNASVFSAAAAAVCLALAPPGSYSVSLDHLRQSRRKNQTSPT